MNRSISLTVGLRYAGAKKRSQLVSFISGISIAGLILGVSLLLVVLSVMNGFDRELRERILGVMPQAAIYHRHGIDHWQQLQQQLEQHPEVDAAAPFVQLQGLASHRRQVSPVSVYGIEPSQESRVSIIESYLAPSLLRQLTAGPDTVILGRGLAEKLKISTGGKLTLVVPRKGQSRSAPRIKVLRTIGILATGTEVDNSLALVHLPLAMSLSDYPDRVGGLRLQVGDLFKAPRIAYELVRDLPYGYYGSDWTRSHGNLFQAIQMSKGLVGLLLFLIIAIAAFNVVSTLIMVVVDKQGDIAILRTLGASTGTIMKVFMVQGLLIGVIGTVIGLLLGVALSQVVTEAVAWVEQLFGIQFLKSDVYPISYLPSDLRVSDIALVGVVSLFMSFVATLYPAWRASRVNPAEALRYE